MLSFEPIALAHKEPFNQTAYTYGSRIAEHAFASLYGWAEKYHTHLSFDNDLVTVRAGGPGRYFHLLPFGPGDCERQLRLMEEQADAENSPFVLRSLTEEMVRQVEALCPGRYHFTPSRDYADYLYRVEDLRDLAGRKYHAKRNHIARFESQYDGRFVAEDITADNLCDVLKFEKKWCRKNAVEGDVSLVEEYETIKRLLGHMEAVDAFGLLLRVDGEVAAFSIGSHLVSDSIDVHIEKADYEMPGSYATINRAFVRRFGEGKTYLDREEDLGLEGLRKSKLSYHPHEIVIKYAAERIE